MLFHMSPAVRLLSRRIEAITAQLVPLALALYLALGLTAIPPVSAA